MSQQTTAELRGYLKCEDKTTKYQENSKPQLNILKDLKH
jgi:hypothetical protein